MVRWWLAQFAEVQYWRKRARRDAKKKRRRKMKSITTRQRKDMAELSKRLLWFAQHDRRVFNVFVKSNLQFLRSAKRWSIEDGRAK
jgi:hypothetical protein